MTTATTRSIGGFDSRPIDQQASLIGFSTRTDSARVHWQTVDNNKRFIVALHMGGLSLHFSPEDAETVGLMLSAAGCGAMAERDKPAHPDCPECVLGDFCCIHSPEPAAVA